MNTNIIQQLESGERKVVENGQVQEDIKKAILDQFKREPAIIHDFCWQDKLRWLNACPKQQFRMCPGAWIRKGTYIGSKVVLMPCFVNIGAYIGAGTMIDSNASIGSCAQIGENCHISSGVIIGGVLEPINHMPVVIKDNCFIGAGCVIAEGVQIETGAVLGAGCIVTASTRIYDRTTGNYHFGHVPAHSVVVPGSYSSGELNIGCVVIVKNASINEDGKAAKNLSINQALR